MTTHRQLIIRRSPHGHPAHSSPCPSLSIQFRGRITIFVYISLIQIRESVSEPITQIVTTSFLIFEYGVLDDSSPDSAMLLVTGFEGTVFFLGEWPTFFGPRLFKEGGAIW